jgi:hypothetical protein
MLVLCSSVLRLSLKYSDMKRPSIPIFDHTTITQIIDLFIDHHVLTVRKRKHYTHD